MNITKAHFVKSEALKEKAKQERAEEEKQKEESKRLEHERRVREYYDMDNIKTKSTKSSTSQIVALKPTILNCHKNDAIVNAAMELDFTDDENVESESSLENLNVDGAECIITSVDTITINNSEANGGENIVNADPSEQSITDESDAEIENLDESRDQNTSAENSIELEKTLNETLENVEPTEEDGESTLNTSLSKAAQIRKGKPIFFNSVNSRHVLLLLRNILYFYGNLHVKLIAGNAQVFGYELQKDKIETVHSTRGHSLIYLVPTPKPTSESKDINAALDKLKPDFFIQDIEQLAEEFDSTTDAIILLERDKSNKRVNMIERYMRETMFPNINAFNNDSPHYSSEFILHCKFSYRPKKGLAINEEWSSLRLQKHTKLVTIGGKGVGKSTFVRYTINSNFKTFNKFLFIDLDIGQPELFVPQTISATVLTQPILGPGYLRNVAPAKAILFGDINVLPDPVKYLQCVLDLHKFCAANEEYRNMPWIINTMGYSRGFGMEIMAGILKVFQPTDVVQIQSQSHTENFDRIIVADEVNNFKFHVFKDEMQNIARKCIFKTHVFYAYQPNGHQKQVDMTSKDLRYAMIFAQLGNCLKHESDWLTSVRPIE